MKKQTDPKSQPNLTAVNIDMSHVPEAWRNYAAIQHRASAPLRMSDEHGYLSASTPRSQGREAQCRAVVFSQPASWSIALPPTYIAWAIIAGLFIWLGLDMVEAAFTLLALLP